MHKITIPLEILNLIKFTMHLYQLVLRLDMDLLYMCLEEQNLMVSTQLILVLIINTYLLVPGTVSAIDIMVLNTTAVSITWSPVPQEEANGNITHYIVSVSLYEGRKLYNRSISVSSDLQVIVNGFSECFLLITFYCLNLQLFLKVEKFLMESL